MTQTLQAVSQKITLSHLDWLEAEAIHIMREVAGQCANPVLLFSGGKDSICMLRLAEKAFRPGRFPFPLLHIDTGHNYPEVIDFRDKRAAELGERLIVRSVEDSMARGTVVLKHEGESRNKHQSVTLLEAIEEFGFDACIGGARRDEEKARAKERIFCFRDEFGQWDPKNQRPELWRPLQRPQPQGREHPRLPDLELDRTGRLAIHRAREARTAVDLLRPHPPGRHAPGRHRAGQRAARRRRTDHPPKAGEADRSNCRCASAPSATSPARRRSNPTPTTSRKIIAETATTTITERGATRLDDQTSDASMEQRKKEGYF